MRLYRISNRPVLDGYGASRGSGWWHIRTPMTRMVYLSEHISTAVLESLVHIQKASGLYPEYYQLLVAESDVDLPMRTVAIEDLPKDWTNDAEATQKVGDEWLAARETALLRVPSVVAADTWNVLLNPFHPDAAALRITRVSRHAFDRRLFLIRS